MRQSPGARGGTGAGAARGRETLPGLEHSIEQEVLREHLWRWLLDLPVLFGEAPLRDEFLAAIGWVGAGRRAELAAFLAGERIAALQSRLLDAADAEDITESAPRFLPSLDARASLTQWPQLDAGFCRAPHWQGRAAETGAMARQAERAVAPRRAFAARWLARLEELRDWAGDAVKVGAGGTASAVPLASGRGRALVETARGLLLHEIVLDGERVADYFIVAPTEWNFHAQGPLPAWLTGRDAADPERLRNLVGRAVAALDPCVRWEMVIL